MLYVIDLFGFDDATASDCVPWFFYSRADARAYLRNAEINGWDWDWVERGEIRACDGDDC